MAMSDHKAKDAAMAAYMKKHPGNFPDSIVRPHPGNGSDLRALSKTMGNVPNAGAHWDRGMIGGIVCARLGLGSFGIPDELLSINKAA